jgi:hypothetical protein
MYFMTMVKINSNIKIENNIILIIHISIIVKMQININDIVLGDLTSELINNLKNDEEDEMYINVDITEQDLKDFNDKIINPSNINSIIKLCDFLMINYDEMKQLIINNIIPTNEKYILNDINKSNCKDLQFIENMEIYYILKYDLIEWLKFKFNKCNKNTLCENSAEKGALKCLKYAKDNGCSWNKWVCTYAARNGHIECLKYLHENGCPWDKWVCTYAALNGQLECLKYAHENGCSWHEETCASAAYNGHIECLKYAHENKCPWNVDTCSYVAQNGHLECLKYAHDNGCPWDENTCKYATLKKQLECLKYAHENGCPMDEWTYNYAVQKGYI